MRSPPHLCNYTLSPARPTVLHHLCVLPPVVHKGSRLTKGPLLGVHERLRSEKKGWAQ